MALAAAVVLTAFALFGLGILKASLSNEPRIRSGIEMMLLTSAAGLAGYLIGVGAQALFDVTV